MKKLHAYGLKGKRQNSKFKTSLGLLTLILSNWALWVRHFDQRMSFLALQIAVIQKLSLWEAFQGKIRNSHKIRRSLMPKLETDKLQTIKSDHCDSDLCSLSLSTKGELTCLCSRWSRGRNLTIKNHEFTSKQFKYQNYNSVSSVVFLWLNVDLSSEVALIQWMVDTSRLHFITMDKKQWERHKMITLKVTWTRIFNLESLLLISLSYFFNSY